MTEPASPSPAIPPETTADRLRRARRYAGLEQTDLADLTGISRATISNYERGETAPLKPYLKLWADACGVDLDWLSGTGPTRRGRNGRLPRRARPAAVLTPLLTAAAGYLITLPGLAETPPG